MLHVILGAPCSGKSTYVSEHAKDGDVRVDFDQLAQTLGSTVAHKSEGHIRQAAFRARKSVIDYCVENSEECESWIIHTSPTAEQLEAYKAAGAEIIEMDTDLETCLERAEQDGRPEGTEQVIRDYYESRKAGKMLRKSFKAAFDETDGGKVRAYASTFDKEPDSYGDIVAKGAFTATLEKWRESGKPIPLLWGHDTSDPMSNIGACYDYGEDERGLWFEASFDADNERAQYVRKLASEGRVYQCSFAYEVKDAGEVELEDGRKAYELRELDLFEISIVQIPANQNATIEEVKHNIAETLKETAAAIKAGRRNSAKDTDELRRIADAAAEITETVNGLLSDTNTDPDDGDDKREDDPEGAKSQAELVAAYKQAIKTYWE